MKVRMRGQMSGTRNGVAWPVAGAAVELPDDEAATLCAQGMAEPVRGLEVETAVAPDAETAVADVTPRFGRRARTTGSAVRTQNG